MATAGGTSSSKKSKKKRHSSPVVGSPNTITYGPPQPAAYPTMPVQQPGYPMQPVPIGFYAPGGYPIQPPGGYPAQMPPGGAPGMMVPATTPIMAQPQRLPQMQQQQQPPPTQRQLDFDQAMSDFKGMFPKMDREVIETVLRSNSGKVDETIDQLLKLNADMPEGAPPPPVMPPSTGMPVPPSQLPPGMFMSESFPDQPPPYSPPEPDSPFSRFNSNSNAHSNPPTPVTSAPPVPLARTTTPTTRTRTPPPPAPAPRRTRSVGGEETVSTTTRDSYRMGALQTSREWNPPMIGNLPADFLRLSVSGDSPSSTPSPSSTQTSQTRVAPGIKQRLEENSNRRRSVGQNNTESNQMLEDEKLALMLQNEEFLRQLQQDPEFLSALERDYHESLRDGRTTSNPTPTTASPASPPISPPPVLPPPRPTTAPLHRQPPPNMATRPLPATPSPGPELPARPPGMSRNSSSSSLTSPGAGGGSRAGMTNGTPSATGGLSVEDIEFRNKLNHMGKSSKTKLSLMAGRFQKKKKASRKYEADEGGAADALLGGESLYEELRDNELSHQVYRKSSKKRNSFGRRGSLLRYEDRDPHFFSR